MVVAELHPVIVVRTTRASPATALAPAGLMTWGLPQVLKAHMGAPRRSYADSITMHRLRRMSHTVQNSMEVPLKTQHRITI